MRFHRDQFTGLFSLVELVLRMGTLFAGKTPPPKRLGEGLRALKFELFPPPEKCLDDRSENATGANVAAAGRKPRCSDDSVFKVQCPSLPSGAVGLFRLFVYVCFSGDISRIIILARQRRICCQMRLSGKIALGFIRLF